MSALASPGTSHHLPVRSRHLPQAKINDWFFFPSFKEIKNKESLNDATKNTWRPALNCSDLRFHWVRCGPKQPLRTENPQGLKPPLSDLMRRQFSFGYNPSHALILVRKHDPDLIESTAVESAAAGIKYILLSGQSRWLTVRIRAAQSRAAHPSGKLSGIPVLLWGIHQNSTWVLCFCTKYPLQGFVACGFDTNLPKT